MERNHEEEERVVDALTRLYIQRSKHIKSKEHLRTLSYEKVEEILGEAELEFFMDDILEYVAAQLFKLRDN